MSKRLMSILLALCMVLTLLPVSALALDGDAGDTGDTPPTTDPVVPAEGGVLATGVYTLTETVTGTITVEAGNKVELNLNGHDVTVANASAIVNKGTLTISGSGNVSAVASANAAIANFPNAVCNVNGGTYSSEKWYIIKNMGSMIIDGAATVTNQAYPNNTSSMIDNGWVNPADTVAGESVPAEAGKASLLIKNGNFDARSGAESCAVVKNDDYGVLEIQGGTFDSSNNKKSENAATILNWNIATISGGTFIGQYPISIGAYANSEADQGLLTITGGTFTGESSIFGVAISGQSGWGKVTISGGTFTAPDFIKMSDVPYAVELSGGQFSTDVSKYVATNYECVPGSAEGTYIVQKLEAKLVVTPPEPSASGEVSATLEGSYAGSGTTIEKGDGETETATTDVTVDLSSQAGGDTVSSAALTVTQETAASLAAAESLTVKTDVGAVTLDSAALGKVGAATNDVEIKIVKNDVADTDANVAAAYTVTVQSATGNLLPDGGSNGMVTITVPVPDGATADALHAWYVTGTGDSKVYVEELTTIPAENGYIAFEIGHLSDIELLSDNPTDGTAAALIVKNGAPTYYADLASALAAADAGDTVTLLRNAESETVLKIPAGVTLDGNQKEITYTGARTNPDKPNNGAFIEMETNCNDVQIKNVTINAGEDIKHGVQFYCVDGGLLENVTVNGAAWTSVMVNGATNVVLKGCVLNPGENAYTNIEFGMGSGVTTIPSMALENVTFGADAPSVWVDSTTVENMKTAMPGDETTDEQILEKIDTSITNLNSGDCLVNVQLADGDDATVITKPSEIVYTVTFDAMGGTVQPASAQTVGGKLSDLPTPVRAGYRFVCWYLQNGMPVTADTVYTADTTIYAYWYYIGGINNPVVDDRDYSITLTSGIGGEVVCSRATAKAGDIVILTVVPSKGYALSELSVVDMYGAALTVNMTGDGAYTFWMPASAVNVQAVFARTQDEAEEPEKPAEEKPGMSFADVAADAWYYDAVAYVYENGLMNGTSLTVFSPDVNITRGMVVTILYRMEGEPDAGVPEFTDVSADAYYTDAVAWAAENDIVKGNDDGTFGPNDDITLEQFAAILYRYAAYKGYDVRDSASLEQYIDADEVSGYALEPMQWAVALGLVKGTSATTLAPASNASRAQIATVLMRFCALTLA